VSVETTSFADHPWGTARGIPSGARKRVVERYRLTSGAKGERVLTIDFEMTDPAFYTKPVTAQKKWMAVPNGHLLPYDCAEEGWRQHLEQLEHAAAK